MKGQEAIQYLKSRREYLGISQRRIGEAIQSSRAYISHIEMRHVNTTLRFLEGYSKFLGIEVYYLVNNLEELRNPLPSMKNLAERLRDLRVNQMTLRNLEEKTSVPSPNLSRIERGIVGITLKTLEKIAEGLNVKPIGLYDRILNKHILENINNS